MNDEHAAVGEYAAAERGANENLVDQVTLSPSQSCSLSDGDHASIRYEVKSITDGVMTLVVTDRFDARSFGGEVKEQTKTFGLRPYKTETKEPEQQGGAPANAPDTSP